MRSVTSMAILFFGCALVTGCAGIPAFNDVTQYLETSGCKPLGGAHNDRDRANPEQLKLIREAKEHYRRGQYGLAEQKFRQASEDGAFGKADISRVANLEALYGLAASYDKLQRFDLSDPIYSHILDTYGESVTYYNNYGYSLQLRGDVEKAMVELEKATRLAPQCHISRNNLSAIKRN